MSHGTLLRDRCAVYLQVKTNYHISIDISSPTDGTAATILHYMCNDKLSPKISQLEYI